MQEVCDLQMEVEQAKAEAETQNDRQRRAGTSHSHALADYAGLYQHPGIAATVDIPHIKRHYYYSHESINPTRVVPLGPVLDLDAPHDRPAARPLPRTGGHHP